MFTKLLLFLAVVNRFSNVVTYDDFKNLKDKDTNYDNICQNVNVTVNFAGIELRQIRENFLSSPIITCLVFNANGIEDIDINAFNNLPNIKYLDVSFNKFHPNTLFAKSNLNLETLLIDENTYNYNNYYYYQIEVKAIQPRIKKLFIRNAYGLSQIIAPSKQYLPSLTHLYLSGSQVYHDKFDWLPDSLEYLDLTGHMLSSLTLKNLKNLNYIFLDNPRENRLSTIRFENLINLKFLSVPSNRISEINVNTFSNMNSLTFLNLADNNIVYIEGGSFDSMKELKFLNLSNNKIEILQSGIFDKLHNLETLVLDRNLISSFPMVGNEIKLKELYLNCNKMKSIVGGTFAKMKYLESLYLHDNEISYIDQEAFAGLVNLKTLTLSNNTLSALPFNWMLPLGKIENIDLTGNHIRDFAHLSLSESSPIQNLYLGDQLHIITTNSLYNIPENLTISVDPNFMFVDECVKDPEKYSHHYSRYG